ncbi:alpha/beta hydrolase [Rhodococcus indonesiensis]
MIVGPATGRTSPQTRRSPGQAAGVKVLVDHRRTPDYPYPNQLAEAQKVYRWLLTQGIEPTRIATVGDSAGGRRGLVGGGAPVGEQCSVVPVPRSRHVGW